MTKRNLVMFIKSLEYTCSAERYIKLNTVRPVPECAMQKSKMIPVEK